MSNILNCEFYCLSFKEENKNKMKQRFNDLDIKVNFYSGLNKNDERIKNAHNKITKRAWSITYSHLDMINDFYYKRDKKYAIICEDDILIHKNFKNILSKTITDFSILNLDVLLLGYLIPYKIGYNNIFSNYTLKKDMPLDSFFKYHNYPEYLSGTQMYMITRPYAKYLIKNYYNNYAGFGERHFMADKILIKDGNRALIYPMLAMENETQEDNYHKLCHSIHYNENYI